MWGNPRRHLFTRQERLQAVLFLQGGRLLLRSIFPLHIQEEPQALRHTFLFLQLFALFVQQVRLVRLAGLHRRCGLRLHVAEGLREHFMRRTGHPSRNDLDEHVCARVSVMRHCIDCFPPVRPTPRVFWIGHGSHGGNVSHEGYLMLDLGQRALTLTVQLARNVSDRKTHGFVMRCGTRAKKGTTDLIGRLNQITRHTQ